MIRTFKTGKEKRTKYIYYCMDGTRIEIVPGTSGVTEVDIEQLHIMDDELVRQKRRYDYRVVAHFEDYYDENLADHNRYLSDNSINPEVVLIEGEEKIQWEDKLKKLKFVIDSLLPQERELFKKKYVENRRNTCIAQEENVSETTIRKRLKKMEEKIKKSFV